MKYETAIQQYFKTLWNYNSKTDNEHTYRTDLQNLLRLICAEFAKNIEPRQEVKDGQPKLGVPDFSFIDSKSLGTVGLLENKAIGANLDALVDSAQMKKYRKRIENVILTNYHDWLLIKNGRITHRASLGTIADIKHKALPEAAVIADLRILLTAFLSQEPRGISRKQELAEQLALRCHDLREFLVVTMERQKKAGEQSLLWDMHDAFQKYVDSHLTLEDFANAFAQTLGYSLFLAKLNVHPEQTTINLYNVQKFIPSSFGLIKALANFLKELEEDDYLPIRYRVEEILGMMNHLYLGEIIQDLSFNKKLPLPGNEEARLFERDPYIYFYEHFLHEYDAKMKQSRGVYYTPPPVVNFIIRGVNYMLKKDFGIADGLADSQEVQMLDFATGTGTFILEALLQMFEAPDVANSKPMQNRLVKDHVLKNLYGFEYLIAPYTIAHLKLSQFLKDKGLKVDEPLKVYLTNTLEMKTPQGDFPFMQKLKAESEAAYKVKEMPIRVIVGNPPYNVKSKNSGAIDGLVKDAYSPEDEKKMNWDDYVKFIRFAHHKMEKIDRGIIGIITNNSYLNAVTLRQMRNRLMRDFNTIYILNLHGNSLIGEQAPDGRQDANVFDIRVGTCIAFFVKTEVKSKGCKVYYGAIKSSKQVDKYKCLVEGDMRLFQPLDVTAFNKQFAATRWAKRFAEPLSFFVPSSDGYAKQMKAYGDFWGVTDIFMEYGSGVKTERDGITIHQTKEELGAVIKDFLTLPERELKQKYETKDSRDWTVKKAKADLEAHRRQDCYADILYRPFDIRKTFYTGVTRGFIGTPGAKIGQQMTLGENYSIFTVRQVAEDDFNHIGITNLLSECRTTLSARGMSYVFPLYLYPLDSSHSDMFSAKEKQENFQSVFRQWLDKKYGKKYMSEQVLGYIYAVLYSPSFRKRYQEFLKIDFPRIPFVDDAKQFEKLSALGWELVQAHIMKTIPEGVNVSFPKDGDNKVTKVEYHSHDRRLYINEEQYFGNVPQEAWDFVIGGYQVLDKYLKERKKADRPLGLVELKHIPRIVRILCFTHGQMQKIDQACQSLG